MATSHSFDLTGQCAVITGAASGIGRALAVGLARAGASVAVTDLPRMHDESCQTADLIRQAGGQASVHDLDVCDTSSLPTVVEAIAAEHGRIDILVNNAGTGIRCPALELTENDWDRIVDLNLKGTFFCAQAVARHMVAHGSGGSIVNMCSSHALIAVADRSPYVASKGGVAALTRALALEWIGLGIRVNAVAPGPVASDFRLQLDKQMGLTPEAIQADMRRRVPLGRRLSVDEIVGATVFLASDAASAMVGHVLVVDGGQVIQ